MATRATKEKTNELAQLNEKETGKFRISKMKSHSIVRYVLFTIPTNSQIVFYGHKYDLQMIILVSFPPPSQVCSPIRKYTYKSGPKSSSNYVVHISSYKQRKKIELCVPMMTTTCSLYHLIISPNTKIYTLKIFIGL